MYVGAGTNWSPVTGDVFGEFLVSDVATPCILYLILYCMVKITVQWQHIKTCKHYSVLSLLPPLVKQKQVRREREEQAAKLARELGRDLKS